MPMYIILDWPKEWGIRILPVPRSFQIFFY